MIRYLLDTSICVLLVRRRAPDIEQRLRGHRPGDVALPAIVLAELSYGAARSHEPGRNLERLVEFCLPFEIVPFDGAAASAYGEVRTSLERAGTPIEPLDTLIAAQAVALQAVLVTDNEREFSRVRGLSVENWQRA